MQMCDFFLKVKLPREVIRISPIYSAVIRHEAPDGHLSKTGYVRLSSFSQVLVLKLITNLSLNVAV